MDLGFLSFGALFSSLAVVIPVLSMAAVAVFVTLVKSFASHLTNASGGVLLS